jgi:hypothetical protein
MATVFRRDGTVNTSQGVAISGCDIYVCTQPANTSTIPPSPLASLFSDPNGAVPLAQPVETDGLGNYFFYAATGTYTIVVHDPEGRIDDQTFPDQEVVSPGGGSVTSVALSMPTEFSVSGSPVTSSGTLAVSKVNQNANKVYAGPTSGGAASPAFRSLVTADLPAGVGTVTSVNASVSAGALFTASFTGGPVTASGTLALTINLAQQAAGAFLAGPSSGGTGPITARHIVGADLALPLDVAFSSNPTFDASAASQFYMTLTGNVTASSVTNPTKGQTISFQLTQDATGSRSFAWPANFKGASPIGTAANSVSIQDFRYDGSFWRGTGPGLVMDS